LVHARVIKCLLCDILFMCVKIVALLVTLSMCRDAMHL
jgi:hypothetical protein